VHETKSSWFIPGVNCAYYQNQTIPLPPGTTFFSKDNKSPPVPRGVPWGVEADDKCWKERLKLVDMISAHYGYGFAFSQLHCRQSNLANENIRACRY
jgi:hypothetical protein